MDLYKKTHAVIMLCGQGMVVSVLQVARIVFY